MKLIAHCTMKVLMLVAPGVAPMNEFDYRSVESAMHRCVQFFPKSPCLKQFKKTGEREYEVICTKESE